ncbi:hypothetical protein HPULCUR_012122 [Helicostylum pulchrum]|uniref:Uncharacterized protein n=1 Tax=Helicostylum pulchrum TaxID=562976 RepID=A0ABP9YI97_9FUNG
MQSEWYYKKNYDCFKSIQTCQVSIVPTTEFGPRFIMKLIYKDKSSYTNYMNYKDGDETAPLYDKNQLDHFVISPLDIRDSFSRFDSTASDILLE